MTTICKAVLPIRPNTPVGKLAKGLRRGSMILMIGLVLAHAAGPGAANPLVYSIGGGGGFADGSNYSLQGTIGQNIAGGPIGGGGFQVQAGFWPAVVVESAGPVPTLQIRILGGNVLISWSPASVGFVLEQSLSLSAPTWSAAPTGNPASISVSSGQLFFRLRQQ
jgi:hypothetical protein